MERLQTQENSLFQETVTLRESLDRARLDITRRDDHQRQLSAEVADITRQLASKVDELQSVRNELDTVKAEKNAKT